MERTKRNFDGTSPTGKKISDLLPEILSALAKQPLDEMQGVTQLWFALMGEKMARFTQVVSLKNGVLTIKVKSATLYALLCQHEKARLLKSIQAKFQVRELIFRVG